MSIPGISVGVNYDGFEWNHAKLDLARNANIISSNTNDKGINDHEKRL